MAGNAGALYLEIQVDDKGSIKVRDFTKEVDKAGKKSEDSFDKAERSARNLDGTLGSLRSTATTLAAAIGAYQLGQFVKDTAMAAARFETLGTVLWQVGENYGYTKGELEAYTQALQDGGIAMLESRGVLLSMMQAEMDLTRARELARAAQDAAVIGNMNSSQAFEAMVYGIQSAQVEILRTIGLNVNFEQSYKKAAQAIGVTTASLTEQQKVQIRTNAVLDAAKGIAGSYESAMTTAGKKISSFTRYVDNFKVEMGKAFQPALVEGVDKATEAMKRLIDEVSKPDSQERLSKLAATAVDTAEDLAHIAAFSANVFGSVLDGWNKLPTLIQEFGILGALVGGAKARLFLATLTSIWGMGQFFADLSDDYFGVQDIDLTPLQDAQMELGRLKVAYEDNVALFEQNKDSMMGDYFRERMEASGKAVEEAEKKVNRLTIAMNAMKHASEYEDDGYLDRWNPNLRPKTVVPIETESSTNTDKAAKALAKVNDELAQLTMTEAEYEGYKSEQRMAGYAAVLGETNPKLKQLMELERARIDNLKRYDVADYAAMEAIPDLAIAKLQGDKDAQDRSSKILEDRNKKDLQLVTDFNKEYLRIVKGETAFKIAQIEEQARVWREAGADSVAVAQWEAEEKLQASREWEDGAIRGLRDYADEARDAARQTEDLMVNGFRNMEDALVQFVKTGKIEFADLAQSIADDLLRMSIQQGITGPMAAGLGELFSGLWMNAHGGAYSSTSLSRYSGQIVDRPTFFAFAHGGVGVMGEGKRKEAIAPLFRDPVSNDLGVKVHGSMGGQPQVNVTVLENSSNTQVGLDQSSNESGGVDLLVTVDDLVAENINRSGSATSAALTGRGVPIQAVRRA